MDKTRELAIKGLYKIDQENAYTNIILNQIIKENQQLTAKDVGLLSQIIYGVITWKLTIDTIIQKYSKLKMKKISPWIINILRIGIYQIIFLDKIPKSAAVNESVKLAKKYGHKSSAGFVNAILRKVTKDDYIELNQIENYIERISKTTSTPEWLVKQLLKERKNEKEVEDICKNLNEISKVTVRRNDLKITKENFEKRLKEKQILFTNLKSNNTALEKEQINLDFYVLEKIKNIEGLDLFNNGYLTVQDFSAGLAAYYLQPKRGDKILDACSAPGGKTTYLAELMHNEGYIEAWDIHKHRTNLVEENAKRLGITIINTKQKDATIYYPEYEGKFDKILLDVPCMGIGVIKRKPDIKWQRSLDDIDFITNVQKQILDVCNKYLKNGGTMIYSTCSILKEENDNVIQEFLKRNSNFELQNIYGDKKCLNILPSRVQDGFFISKLKKLKNN